MSARVNHDWKEFVMKVLGISCSPRSGQTTDQLVKAVLDAVDPEDSSLAKHQAELDAMSN